MLTRFPFNLKTEQNKRSIRNKNSKKKNSHEERKNFKKEERTVSCKKDRA